MGWRKHIYWIINVVCQLCLTVVFVSIKERRVIAIFEHMQVTSEKMSVTNFTDTKNPQYYLVQTIQSFLSFFSDTSFTLLLFDQEMQQHA